MWTNLERTISVDKSLIKEEEEAAAATSTTATTAAATTAMVRLGTAVARVTARRNLMRRVAGRSRSSSRQSVEPSEKTRWRSDSCRGGTTSVLIQRRSRPFGRGFARHGVAGSGLPPHILAAACRPTWCCEEYEDCIRLAAAAEGTELRRLTLPSLARKRLSLRRAAESC